MQKLTFFFDLFGTVFDMSNVDRREIGEYVAAVKHNTPPPRSVMKKWESIPPHGDVLPGLLALQSVHNVVTLSNCPLWLQAELSGNAGLLWTATVPLETIGHWKPNIGAYQAALKLLDVNPDYAVMVTANETFGDLEAAASLGMQSRLLRRDGDREFNMQDLAEEFTGRRS